MKSVNDGDKSSLRVRKIAHLMALYRILSLSQRIFAWGAEAEISRQVLEVQNSMPHTKDTLLDLGCDPKSWITQTGVASHQHLAAPPSQESPRKTLIH
jgi:hypothetical protein